MSKVVGIASLLYDGPREEVLRFWDIAEKEYGSVGVRTFAHPNLGFQGALCNDVQALKQELQTFVEQMEPTEMRVNGFGYFVNPGRVIYLRVEKTPELVTLHNELNSLLERHCQSLFDLYTPARWVPHITVAMGDLTEESFESFNTTYNGYPISFTQSIPNLALVEFKDSGQVELIQRYEQSS